jgi:predicted alpha-1,6-mannanase (GH76 family)
MCRICLLLALIVVFQGAKALSQQPIPVEQVQHGVDRLEEWYNPQTGLWDTAGWWSSANAMTVLVDYSRATGLQPYHKVIENTFRVNREKGFTVNRFYDDEGWWALAWIDAYDLTGNHDYLDMAAHLLEHMKQAWDNTCGGGLWQTTDRVYKDAIVNELFLSVAAHLANRTDDPKQRAYYAEWAEREWAWFAGSGMIEDDNLIADGLDPQCMDNHHRKFTYNQGVILGGLIELQKISGRAKDLAMARSIADATLLKKTDAKGILHEPCEVAAVCSRDTMQFKGIFVRNLAILYARSPDTRYAAFLHVNAASILANAGGEDNVCYGVIWSAPPTVCNPVTQSAALDALIAALTVEHSSQKQNPHAK